MLPSSWMAMADGRCSMAFLALPGTDRGRRLFMTWWPPLRAWA